MLDEKEQQLLLDLARSAISARLADAPAPEVPRGAGLDTPAGAFVTLRTKGDGRLRGCIGQIEATEPVAATVARVAVNSAIQDPRFARLETQELDSVWIEISVLSALERLADPRQIVIGDHGLYLTARGRAGLLLPQVASQREWDVETFLTQTCFKAGLNGTCWQDPRTEVYTFTAQVFSEEA